MSTFCVSIFCSAPCVMVFTLVGQRSVLNSSWVNQNDVYVVEGAELTVKQIDRSRYPMAAAVNQ